MNVSLEFALNVLWAVVSLALLLGARKSNPDQQAHKPLRTFALIALICVLFPIISITDDLNSAPALVETRQSVEVASQHQHGSGAAGTLPALLPAHSITLTASQHESIAAATITLLPDLFAFNESRRPPPSLTL
jgi:hypothetical protein